MSTVRKLVLESPQDDFFWAGIAGSLRKCVHRKKQRRHNQKDTYDAESLFFHLDLPLALSLKGHSWKHFAAVKGVDLPGWTQEWCNTDRKLAEGLSLPDSPCRQKETRAGAIGGAIPVQQSHSGL